jgi:DNA polymerase III sliding clamp (beta) subunit (PCNA family)
LIPAYGADQLKRIFGKGNHSLDIKRTVCPDTIDPNGKPQPATQYWIVRSRDTTVSGRILTGNFPDYERVMPHYEGQPARLTAADLLTGIDAVYSSADERSHAIQFHFNSETVKLIASTAGGASASIEVPCETGIAHGVTVGLNADYVRDFAKSLRKDDSVYISCAGLKEAIHPLESDAAAEVLGNNELADERRRKSAASSSWGFSSEIDSGYKHVIMPMRVN